MKLKLLLLRLMEMSREWWRSSFLRVRGETPWSCYIFGDRLDLDFGFCQGSLSDPCDSFSGLFDKRLALSIPG